MTINLDELVTYRSPDEAAIPPIRKAMEWIGSTPEGKAILEESKALHKGKLLHVFIGAQYDTSGFGMYEEFPSIMLNPQFITSVRMHDVNGNAFPQTLERFFFHELKHATQPPLSPDDERAIRDREMAARFYNQKTERAMHPYSFDEKKFKHRLANAKGDKAKIEKIYAQIFDKQTVPILQKAHDEMTAELAASERFQNLVREREIPAIEFENAMMAKYFNAPARTTDYAKSASPDLRQPFIDTHTAKYLERYEEERLWKDKLAARRGNSASK